jgi:hypothetical protein
MRRMLHAPPADRHRIHQIVQSTEQWGEWAPYPEGQPTAAGVHGPITLADPQGKTHSPNLGVLAPPGSVRMARYGKKRAGHALDGTHYQQLPGHYDNPDSPNTVPAH